MSADSVGCEVGLWGLHSSAGRMRAVGLLPSDTDDDLAAWRPSTVPCVRSLRGRHLVAGVGGSWYVDGPLRLLQYLAVMNKSVMKLYTFFFGGCILLFFLSKYLEFMGQMVKESLT